MESRKRNRLPAQKDKNTTSNNHRQNGNSATSNGSSSNNNYKTLCQNGYTSAGDAGPLLLSRKQVPKYTQEPAIYSGYRPCYQSWTYYLKSLFWIHNETGNIWTHLLSPLLTALVVYRYSFDINFRVNESAHGLLVYMTGSSIMLLLSAVAHWFHSKSPVVHYVMFSLDYFGVAMMAYGHGIMIYYCCGDEMFYRVAGKTFLWFHMLTALFATMAMILGRTFLDRRDPRRKLTNILSTGFCLAVGQTPVFFRMYSCYMFNEPCLITNVLYHQLEFFGTLLCGVLFALHLPEKAFPGKFDICGHGHQLFHIAVTLSVWADLHSAYLDLMTIPNDVLHLAEPNIFSIWCNFAIFLMTNVIVLVTLLSYKIYNAPEKSEL